MKKFEKVFKKARIHYLKGHVLRSKFYRIFMKLYYQCDIPPNCTAVGIPARIIRRGES